MPPPKKFVIMLEKSAKNLANIQKEKAERFSRGFLLTKKEIRVKIFQDNRIMRGFLSFFGLRHRNTLYQFIREEKVTV